MTTVKKTFGDYLIQGMNEALEYTKGNKKGSLTYEIKIPENIDVSKLRKNLHLSRANFAKNFGISARTLQHWEQGDRRPTRPTRLLLAILEREPTIVSKYFSFPKKKGHDGKKEKKTASR